MRYEVCQEGIPVYERSEVFLENDERITMPGMPSWGTNALPLYNVIFNAIALATA